MLIAKPAAAEIIAPDKRVDVYIRPSPMRQEVLHLAVQAGSSVEEIVSECAAAFRLRGPERYLHVTLDGHVIEQRLWPRVRVKPGVSVNIVRIPSGGVGRILSSVVSLVALLVAPYIAGPLVSALGITGLVATRAITGLVAAGLSLAGSLAVNALFPTAQAEDKTTPLYSIGGAQNKAAQYSSIPVIMGTHRVSPPYASGAYSEVSGNNQFLRLLFCLGYGPMAVSDIKIGETPIEKFDEVDYHIVENHLTEPLTIYTRPTYEESISVLLASKDGWTSRTTADDVDEVSVDIGFPSGVGRYDDDDGKKKKYKVVVEIQYRNTAGGSWLTAGTVTVETVTAQAMRRTVRWQVATGKYEVRVRKASSDFKGKDTVSEATYWTALRARRFEKVVMFDQPLTLLEMRIKATNELSGTVDQLNCLASPLIRSWNGATWASGKKTSNPADWFREVLQGRANARPVANASIDLESLQDWHDYCRRNKFTFDLVATDAISVYDRLVQIASAGRAAVTLRDGRWGVVWDEPKDLVVQHFTPRNSWGFSSARAYADLPHGFRVAFINGKNGYLNDERVVYDDGYGKDNATKFEGLEFPGVVDPDLIWRHGRYHLAQLRLQRETYTLNADFENLVCTKGDRVRVNHDVVLWGAGAARVKAVSASPDTVTVDDTFTMEAGKTYSIRFRLSDGSSLVRTITGVAGDHSVLALSGSGSLPAPGDLVMFGENGLDSVVLRVKSVTAQPDLTAKLELVDDAPEIASADKGTIPPFRTGIASQVDYRAYGPKNLVVIEAPGSQNPPRSVFRLSWTAPVIAPVASYFTQIALKGSEDWSKPYISTEPAVEIPDIESGLYQIRVRAVFENGQISAALNGDALSDILSARPGPVPDFRIAVSGDIAILQWQEVTDAAVSHYEIRFSPSLVGVTWLTASGLRENVTGNQIIVPAMRGTYLIRAVSYGGLQSPSDSVVVNGIDPLTKFNAIELRAEAPAFAGVRDDTQVASGRLRLATTGDVFLPLDFFEADDFFLAGGGYAESGIYYFAAPVDLGQVYTSRVSAAINAYGERTGEDIFKRPDFFDASDFYGDDISSLWSVKVQVSVTADNPAGSPTWSDWTDLSAGDITARAYRFRAVLTSRQYDVTPVVTGLTVSVDMPDRIVAESDLVVSAAGRTILFSPPFHSLQGLSIAAQGLTTGDYYQITAKTEAGFTIIFRNASGTAVARSFDYVAKGYGIKL